MAEQDDLTQDEKEELSQTMWKSFQGAGKKGEYCNYQWMLYWDGVFRGYGNGFETFKACMIAVSDGKGWNNETQTQETEESDPSKSFPSIGMIKWTVENRKGDYILAIKYCDDAKHNDGMTAKRRKMGLVQHEKWFVQQIDGFKKRVIKHWASEGEITSGNLDAWYLDGDRL